MLHKHQRALRKYSLMKRQMSAAAHGREPESAEQLESRIVEVLRAWGRGRACLPGAGPPLVRLDPRAALQASVAVPSAPLGAWLGRGAV